MIILSGFWPPLKRVSIFWGSWDSSKNWLEPKTTITNFNQERLVQILDMHFIIMILQGTEVVESEEDMFYIFKVKRRFRDLHLV